MTRRVAHSDMVISDLGERLSHQGLRLTFVRDDEAAGNAVMIVRPGDYILAVAPPAGPGADAESQPHAIQRHVQAQQPIWGSSGGYRESETAQCAAAEGRNFSQALRGTAHCCVESADT